MPRLVTRARSYLMMSNVDEKLAALSFARKLVGDFKHWGMSQDERAEEDDSAFLDGIFFKAKLEKS